MKSNKRIPEATPFASNVCQGLIQIRNQIFRPFNAYADPDEPFAMSEVLER